MSRFPLTIPQQGLWSGHLLNDDKAMFNTAECIAFDGKVDVAVLVAALTRAVGECEALKGHFEDDGEAVCFVSDEAPLAYGEVNLESDDEVVARAWAWADLRRPFKLTEEAPCRFALLRGPGRDYLYSCVHHIALDGFGTTLLFQRIAELYGEGLAGAVPSPSPFGLLDEVLAEELAREESGKNAAARSFWQEQLQAWPEVKSFGETRAPIAAEFIRESRPLPAALWQSLTGFADEHKLGWPDLLLAGLSAQLSLASGQQQTLLGLMMMNRIGSASLTVPCMQMNITPLALALGEELDLAGAAGAVAKAKAKRGVRKHQHYRYELLRRDLGLVGGDKRLFGPLVNIMPFDHARRFGPLSAHILNISAGPVEDLTIEVQVGADGQPRLDLDANPGCYQQQDLATIADTLFALLGRWLAQPAQNLGSLKADSLAEQRQGAMITAPAHEVIKVRPVLDALCHFAAQTPNKIALIQGEASVSYEALLARCEQMAAALQASGVQPGDRVGVMLARSPLAIFTQLAVLLAGAVYVPLDPEQPLERQGHILRLGEVKTLITQAEYRHKLASLFEGRTLLAGDLVSDNRLNQPAAGRAVAYLMFTSGSTGLPKGVAVSHGALDHFAAAARCRYHLNEGARMLQFAPFNFDASIEEVFATLSAGATLVLRTDALLESMAAFAAGVEQMGITHLDLPTAFWNEWVVALTAGQAHIPASLATVIIGGEAVYPEQLAQWQRQGRSDVRLFNTYGPTETTVVVTTQELQQEDPNQAQLPIGLPLPGMQALILGAGEQPASEGELVLLGPQLANGYVGGVQGSFETLRVGEQALPVYRTGDRVRLAAGRLVYLGRRDNEFKISGYRIQPGEVEAQLLALPGVDEACVQGVSIGSVRRLVAFVAGSERDSRAIKAQLAKMLPAAMIPTDYRHYDQLPRTGSNKLDRKALLAQYQSTDEALTLGSETENRVGAIWQQILGLATMAPADNFFELGGQSLQTIQIVNRLGAEFGVQVKVSDVFDHPRLDDFCRFLDGKLTEDEESVEMVW
ncbi:TPA: amonabactin biosynthesis non-ribosomal peptide synthetase AmoF [Aeromonas salmonicida subsp. salmonicida]|uniref:amonabactin biosynthesis non-ribosomal peptide synthetase AmoF n=1 Tax=Aeromonas salmonicida TaxID=645 RepID=UPI00131F7FD1|nr:amonabactin biosynthesis non-ribosomal peptide synthetase AmoF [Aeromonas salmonicida]ELI6417777.1 amonabactin biosynthesis non-ribosomal peptide synthetase AmoF [Aeromonas salmonicida subsp. salmonicida]ELM3646115.1 amonabactin biosynthesis non-ribosomal peptide synthetase AmoF [Aeromonas salmonicida subsp. salmonicida]QHE42838.1 amonabactin biosynthesis non-ribosomal peptide synthetase AmoF [Aeromonas salmonicida subsp. salmonicida]